MIDYLTGYEISLSIFYLGPVAVAAWYAQRRTAIVVAVIACAIWCVVDRAAGSHYSHPAIPVWNAFVRFGFLGTTALLLAHIASALVDAARDDDTSVAFGVAWQQTTEGVQRWRRRRGTFGWPSCRRRPCHSTATRASTRPSG